MEDSIYNVTKKSGIGGRQGFKNLQDTYSNCIYPTTMSEVLEWGDVLWTRCGDYSTAITKMIRYFLVDIEIESTSDYKTKKKYKDFFIKEMGILNHAFQIAVDLQVSGNSFISMYKPITRDLQCKKCKILYALDRVQDLSFEYEESKDSYVKGCCPKCGSNQKFNIVDIEPTEDTPMNIVRWSPNNIQIEHNPVTETSIYKLKPSSKLKAKLNSDIRVMLKDTPLPILDCIASDGKVLTFDKSIILHLKTECLATLKDNLNGWGIPNFMSAFEEVVHLNVLKRYNEAIMLDYLIPFRFITPSKGGPDSDPLLNIDGNAFNNAVLTMLQEQRSDPTRIHTMPFSVDYHAMGGEAKMLAPVEQIRQATEDLLRVLGIPQEFYATTLQAGGPMMGLRMFERQHGSFFKELNRFLDWTVTKASEAQAWEGVSAKFTNTSVFEDENLRSVRLDLMGANKVSHQTALKPMGIDYEYEIDKIAEEQSMFEEKMMHIQRQNEKAMELQGVMDQPIQDPAMPPEGGPMPMAGPAPTPNNGTASMDELHMQAEQLAQEIFQDPNRQSRLIQLKKDDEALHALVKEKIKAIERDAGKQGVTMASQGQL